MARKKSKVDTTRRVVDGPPSAPKDPNRVRLVVHTDTGGLGQVKPGSSVSVSMAGTLTATLSAAEALSLAESLRRAVEATKGG
jgi:hypothetical protein